MPYEIHMLTFMLTLQSASRGFAEPRAAVSTRPRTSIRGVDVGAPLAVPAATRYPGVSPRAIAVLIDGAVGFVVIGIPILWILGKKTTVNGTGGTTTTHSTNDPKVLALWAALAIVYYVVFEAWLAALRNSNER